MHKSIFFKQIFADRWFIWFISISIFVAVALFGYIQHSLVEMGSTAYRGDRTVSRMENSIHVNSPVPNQVVRSPFNIFGEAKGTWFFEASFPIKFLDDDGNVIKIAIATAQSDWMTEDFVPFTSRVDFSVGGSVRGKVVFQKDNPSGLPENDYSYSVPVVFSSE